MSPCSRPAKKARIVRWEGEMPPTSPVASPVLRCISGNEASFEGLNPSEVFALHKTLIELLNKFESYFDVRGPYSEIKQFQ